MHFPNDIWQIILDYKRQMEDHEHWVRFLEVVFNNLLWPGFVV